MVSASSSVSNLIAGASSLITKKTSADSAESFANKLATALEKLLAQSDNGSHLETEVEPAAGQNSGERQFVIKISPPTVASAAVPPAPTSAVTAAPLAASTPQAPTDAVAAQTAATIAVTSGASTAA